MSEEEIREGNILIHKFMGRDDEALYKVSEYENGYHAMSDFIPGKYLCYHKSWDLLMEVIKKIESLQFQFWIGKYGTTITSERIGNWEINEKGEKSDALYKAIIKVIKSHNQQKKK